MKPEIMSPAGNWVDLTAAIKAGADSIYFGIKGLNMRANASNFEVSELGKVVEKCHSANIKAYLTLNTIIYDNEIKKIKKIIYEAANCGIDGIIAWDMAVISEVKKAKIPIILSTQACISNSQAMKFYEKIGVKRVTLARELSLEQVKEIKKNTTLEIEMFVHGAMCVSESGRCFISQFLFNRSANRGDCLQPCRRQYEVKDLETGDELVLENNFIMSPKDLCALPFIDRLIEAGIDAFKIEGRNRSPEYVKVVTSCYKKAIDAIDRGKFTEEFKKELVEELSKVYNRKFSTGFFLGKPTVEDWTDIYGSNATTEKKYVGKVKNFYNKINVIELKIESGEIKKGDTLMIQGNKTGVIEQKIKSIQINNKNVEKATKGQRAAIKIDDIARVNDKLFLINSS